MPGLTLSVLQTLESGVPYGAVNTNGVDPRPYVTNPGNAYLTPPASSTTTYFFTSARRVPHRRPAPHRPRVNYARRSAAGGRMRCSCRLQVLNLFNQFQLCACGGTVFGTGSAANAGGVNLQRIDTAVLTPVTTPSRYATFNPFTTTPVQGVNWDYGPAVRPGDQPLRLHDAENVQNVVRR